VIVIDMARVMREAKAAQALRTVEVDERRALREELDALKLRLEREEAEMVELRRALPKDEFDLRVRDFDQRVRAARRGAQESAAALQARFTEALRALEAAAGPVIDAVMAERRAAVALDRRAVLRVSPGVEATDDVIARLDAAQPPERVEALIPPAPAADQP
jgi:Skp family chaperone for outer membrane proteins